MPSYEAPCVELGSAPETNSIAPSPSPSEISSTSSPEPQIVRATPLFRMLAMPPPEPVQPPGQEELERRLPGYRRIVIPRELTLIELLKQCSGAITDEDVLRIREAKIRVIAERVGLRRIHVLAPRLRSLTLDGSAIPSLRDLGIGLVKLKFLSVNRCTLTSLDGVWGLSALRELHASGNRLQDLQPLAVLQKLHTLNLADNPISESSRLWTLGVCSALRKLTLRGTPAASSPTYRAQIASALPMLTHLDERPMHNDVEYDMEDLGEISSSSDSEEEDLPEVEAMSSALPEPEPCASTSKQRFEHPPKEEATPGTSKLQDNIRRRPATTECAGARPPRPRLPRRPHTAKEHQKLAPSRLEVMNTLLDDEWRCSGSALTSRGPLVCGNLARALRRPASAQHRNSGADSDLADQAMANAARSVAAEIPRAPRLEDWAKFREDTGIDIDINFNERPKGIDPNIAIDRLEEIERETLDRFKNMERSKLKIGSDAGSVEAATDEATKRITRDEFYIDYEMWTQVKDLTVEPRGVVDDIFDDMAIVQSIAKDEQ